MKKRTLNEIVVFSIIVLCLFSVNAVAFDLPSPKNLTVTDSTLFNPVFPDVQMPDFKFNSNASNPGVDYSLTQSSSGADYGKLHRYFGFATIALAGVAAVTSSNKSVHYGAAYATTGAALLTCWTGYEEYSERFDLEEGLLAQDNLHILLGVIGTVAIVTSVATADSGDDSSHAGIGVAGGSMMLISVALFQFDF